MHFVAMAEYGRAMKNATPEHFWVLGLHVRRAAPFPLRRNPAQILSAATVVWISRRNAMMATRFRETGAMVPAGGNIAVMVCRTIMDRIISIILSMMRHAMTADHALCPWLPRRPDPAEWATRKLVPKRSSFARTEAEHALQIRIAMAARAPNSVLHVLLRIAETGAMIAAN